tara:strand:+ start:2798 stop:3004 length:207 start_codon:yes stop_codon:yes gene_type:complete
MEHQDEQWLDENVTIYVAGSIPVNLTPAEAKREFPGGHGFGAFVDQYTREGYPQTTYRARLVFEWLGY